MRHLWVWIGVDWDWLHYVWRQLSLFIGFVVLFRQCVAESSVGDETISSGKDGSTVTLIFLRATYFGVCSPVRLNSVLLGALVTFPFFLAVLSAEVLLNASEVAQCSCRAVVDTWRFRTDVDPLPNLCGGSLLQLPRQVVASPMKLEVLVSLKAFVADLTHEPVCGH